MKNAWSTRFFILLFCLMASLEQQGATLVSLSKEASSNSSWSKFNDKLGISGYEHGVLDSKYLETRSETIIDVRIEVLLEVLNDIPSYPQWMYQCTEAVLLNQEGKWKRVLYFAQGLPLGSPDRQVVLEALTTEKLSVGRYVTNIHSTDHRRYHIPTNGHINERQWMIKFNGTWELQMLDRNRTKVIYTAYSDPGGFAPGFIVNGVIRNVTFRSLEGMKSKAKEVKYIEAARQSEVRKRIETAIREGRLIFHKPSQPSSVQMMH